MSLDLEYFYGNEAEQYSFYRIPKVLLTDLRYKGVSMEAKVLYGLMLDRMGLSIRSGWLDGDGRVYIYFTLEDAIAMLGCGKDKAVRLFKELDIGSGIGLIERRKQGQGKPARVYVKKFTLPPSAETPEATPPPTQTSEIPKSGLRGDSAPLTSEKPKSALLESSGQDFGKSAANKTDKNNTELSDTELSIHPPAPLHASPPDGARHRLRMDEMDWYREVIKENIDYDLLCMDRRYDVDEIDGYVELMAEICASGRGYIRVNGVDVPTELVKERFLKLNSEHLQYVMECLRSCTTQVVNIENHAKCIERSNEMLKLLNNAVELLRTRHKNGEAYYWVLYYTFLSPQQLDNVNEIIEQLQPHIRDISRTTYYRKREQAVDALSSILWGYTSKDCMALLTDFFPTVEEEF